ncbi:MAG TPA: MarR family winged helix-turn-helix transcriptional regulator [Chitinophagaceae bacterium]|nr:MarR family winged helix-turn-helix transcriptional regulator [Chitinophagaceae bacterium]MCC6635003.1 winged helix-turn-helix transcriptional regulator [Chitinophagaceae bacterium]HMZ45298.1 MarR family winged helix-turn-helix transcriptional regulator [Chitinophagaceae bacterium]HNE93219.1 MarR family winged helix-turn-helix transcriptional regulator [Chitinophagaceae bacterium]HNF28963.1 MarR family winged helix-turn-helix transcriptional regulator [Chitinophagaceae bacterium]
MKKSDFNLQVQNDNIESKIVASLERIAQAFRVLLWQETKEFSLSPIQVQILIFLLNHSKDKCKVSYLAAEFNLTKATISDTIKTLEQKKLIEKEYEVEDSRSYIIHLTQKGKEIAQKTSFFTNEIKSPISKLSSENKEHLYCSLLDIIKYLNTQKIVTIQRSCINCTHYQTNKNGLKHFCKLLNSNLSTSQVRIDCPLHQEKL